MVPQQQQVRLLDLGDPVHHHLDHVVEVGLSQRQALLVELGALQQREEVLDGRG